MKRRADEKRSREDKRRGRESHHPPLIFTHADTKPPLKNDSPAPPVLIKMYGSRLRVLNSRACNILVVTLSRRDRDFMSSTVH